ncbi:MAG: 50S ribosomal protein L9 [Eggerthellaceae bacterium]|nr:50S ribosomal protein L9 [Eggerthellaceae bacterium]
MKVILLDEVRGKGGEGDVVEVARGFANNYLLRKGLAVKATPGNLKQLEQRRKNIAKREEVRINGAETRKGQLEAMTVTIATKVGEEGQLFGSVTAQMIADAIAEQNEGGVEVDRRRIDVRTPIKTVGEHEVEVSLYREIKATVKIVVVDEAAPEEPEEEPEVEAAPEAEAEAEAEVAPEAPEAEEATEEAPEEA